MSPTKDDAVRAWTVIMLLDDPEVDFLIMDSRAIHNFDSALCHEVCETLREAKRRAPEHGDHCCVFSVGAGVACFEWQHGVKPETPSLTTEQARSLASRWASDSFMDYDFRERLFAWVRAYADAASAEGLDVSDVAGNLSIELNLDSGDEYDEQQAGELLKAARWPS